MTTAFAITDSAGHTTPLEPGRTLVGRHPQAALRVLDGSVAVTQFWLETEDAAVCIVPGSQVPPTYVNDEPLRTPRRIGIEDRIRAGSSVFRLVALGSASSPGPSQVEAGEATLVGAATGRAVLAAREIPLRGTTLLGRAADADVDLPSVQVSRHHARIDVRPSQTLLTDLGSSNGTFVNGTRLRAATPLHRGDVVTIGPYELVFTGWSLEQRGGGAASVAAIGISQVVPDPEVRGRKRPILQPTDLVVHRGEFLAIVGESGGGKSTLVNLLSGRATPATGQVLVDGLDLRTNLAAMRPRLAYVPQKNTLFEELTVAQNLHYTARLRLPADTDASDLAAVVTEAIAQVGLVGHEATRFRDLSGGQKKRASLANEILARPGVLFVDEVTSGLDEGTDREIMQLLRELSRSGVTVVCVTHTLRHVAACCDRVVVLGQPGQLLFVGSSNAVLQFFAVEELGEVFTRLQADPTPLARSRLRRRFVDSDDHHREVEMPLQGLPRQLAPDATSPTDSTASRAEFLRQVRIATERAGRLLLLDTRTLAIALGQAVLVGLAIVAVFGRVPDDLQHVPTQQTILFLLAVSCLWFGCSNASKELVKERDLFRQEAEVNLQPCAYLAAKGCVLGTLALVQVAVLVAIVGSLSGIGGSLGWQTAVLAATGLAGTALGLCISAFARDRDQANTIVPIVLVPQIIMAGRIAQLPNAVEWFAGGFVSSYWSYAGLDAVAAERWGRATAALSALLAHGAVAVALAGVGLLVSTRTSSDPRQKLALWWRSAVRRLGIAGR